MSCCCSTHEILAYQRHDSADESLASNVSCRLLTHGKICGTSVHRRANARLFRAQPEPSSCSPVYAFLVHQEAICALLFKVEAVVPYSRGDLLSRVHELGACDAEEYTDAGTFIQVCPVVSVRGLVIWQSGVANA